MEQIERLLERLVEQNTEILHALQDVSFELKSLTKTVSDELNHENKTSFAHRLNEGLNWTDKYSFAGQVLKRLDAIESAISILDRS